MGAANKKEKCQQYSAATVMKRWAAVAAVKIGQPAAAVAVAVVVVVSVAAQRRFGFKAHYVYSCKLLNGTMAKLVCEFADIAVVSSIPESDSVYLQTGKTDAQ